MPINRVSWPLCIWNDYTDLVLIIYFVPLYPLLDYSIQFNSIRSDPIDRSIDPLSNISYIKFVNVIRSADSKYKLWFNLDRPE